MTKLSYDELLKIEKDKIKVKQEKDDYEKLKWKAKQDAKPNSEKLVSIIKGVKKFVNGLR